MIAALVAVTLAGCGQKGPLFLPDTTGTVITRESQAPETAPAPATAPGAPATPATEPSKPDRERAPAPPTP